MSLQIIPQQLEIVLWTSSIRLMKTSPAAARAVIRSHDAYRWIHSRKLSELAVLLALSGFASGFLLGLIFLGIQS